MHDSVINKLSAIKRCISRIEEEFRKAEGNLKADITRQDSIVLNLQRACEASIDLANYVNKQKELGIPQSSRDAFTLLEKANYLPVPLADNLKKMVGLRNIAVHNYQELNIEIVVHVVTHNLKDFEEFCEIIKRLPLE